MTPKMYDCEKCGKRHRNGKIYTDHWQYRIIPEQHIPTDKILINTFDDLFSLRPIAVRQIHSLWIRKKRDNRPKLYVREINRLIMYERGEL